MHAVKDIRPLTSLRFFAAMWVVLFHYWPNLAGGEGPGLVAKGYLGVELFFTLSGFILCHVYLDSVADGGFRYASFLWARLARVYPLHLATLTGIGAIAVAGLALGLPVDPNILAWRALPANLLLVHAWGLADVAGWNHPSWSISAEWLAYLTFPAFAWAALKLRSRPWVAVASALAFLIALYTVFHALTGQSLTRATIAWGALRIVPCFAYGCALNLVWRSGAVRSRSTALAGAVFSGALALTIAQFGGADSLIVAVCGALILFLASLTSAGENSGGGNIFVYLGEISYSIYMICVPWKLVYVNVVARIGGFDKAHLPLPVWILFLASVIPLAALSYHLIERPARGVMRRWADTPTQMLTSVA